jgi:O-antigen ligase
VKKPTSHVRSPFAPPAERLRPWLLAAVAALWVARPLYPSESAAPHGDGLPLVMLWLVLAVLWSLGALGRRPFSLRFGRTDAAVLLLISLHTAAALWAAARLSPRPAVNMLWEWIGLAVGYFLTRQLLRSEREVRALAAVMIALAVGLSAYGFYQCTVEMPRTRAQYAADPERTLREAGFWFPPGSPQRQHFESRLQNNEPISTFALTNSLAAMLAPWLVIAMGIVIGSSPGQRRSSAVCAILIAGCLLLSKSRSSYIAVCFGLVLVWVNRRRLFRGTAVPSVTAGSHARAPGWKLPAGIALAATLLAAAALAVGGPHHALLAKAATSLGYRVQYWQATMHLIADHPWAGCGPGNFQDAYTAYKLPQASEEVADPHNFLLEVWATAGTPAMLALAAVLASFFCAACYGRVGRAESALTSTADTAMGDAATFVLGGGLLGFLLAWPLGQLSAAPPGPAATLLGLPLAAATALLLSGWVRQGRLPPLLPAIGVAVMLVNLLAAGGIGQPGVAGSFWLLLALGLFPSATGVSPVHEQAHGQAARGSFRPVAFAMLSVAMTLAVCCYLSGYGPVLRSQAHMRTAEQEMFSGRLAEAEAELGAAAAADPLAAEPWRQLATLSFADWRRDRKPETYQRFTQCMTTALGQAPHSAATWLAAGDRYLEIFVERGPAEALSPALEAYRRAVELYPNDARCHAKLALACQAAGDRAGLRREARTALRLDQLTPHEDKKLPAELREKLGQSQGLEIGD